MIIVITLTDVKNRFARYFVKQLIHVLRILGVQLQPRNLQMELFQGRAVSSASKKKKDVFCT